ncbi:MAG: hypothetical protein KDA91_14235 [Planctomycetaceae bacterium]|nr:hypothetical protein [Planctomycetaceae bacterium]
MAFPDAVDSRRQSSTTLPTSTLKADPVWQSECERYVLWIDGVGAWQLCMGGQFLIGGPTLEHQAADICLLANLSRQHATLKRIREDWFIQPHAATVVSGRTITDQTLLKTGDQIKLAERVRLGFRIPSILSGSAVIDFESSHRPTQSVNGIILMTDTCLLGPRRDHHVCCPDWGDLVVLFRQDGQLRCRSKLPLKVNDVQIRDSAPLQDGAIVSCEDLRFRIEKMKDGNGPSGRST